MSETPQHGHLPNWKVTPSPEVMDEITERNTSVGALIEEAKLLLIEMQGEESGVARMFVERGYSDPFANWIAQEAKAREESPSVWNPGA